MTTPTPSVELPFQGNTFLGFMAGMGVLRLATEAGCEVRCGWKKLDHRARLEGLGAKSLVEVVTAALPTLEPWPNRTLGEGKKRLSWNLCGAGRAQIETAGKDADGRKKKGEIENIVDDLRSDRGKVERTLLEPWTWQDEGDSFGWVPTMKAHALRARKPSDDKSFRDNAAIWLAWEGIPAFSQRTGGIAGWTSTSTRSPCNFTWPLWETPASLRVVRSILRSQPRSLGDMGVFERWTVQKVSTSGWSMILTEPCRAQADGV